MNTSNFCACELDTDGQCAKCRERALLAGDRFSALMGEFGLAMEKIKAEFMKKVKKISADLSGVSEALDLAGPCDGCEEKYADFLLSRIVHVLVEQEPEVAFRVMQVAMARVRARGIKKLPLTEKAWRETGGPSLEFP